MNTMSASFKYYVGMLASFALVSAALTGCKSTASSEDCTKPFELVVDPSSVKNHQIYIALEKLLFLEHPNFVLEDVELQVTIRGKHKVEEDITLDLNGIKLSRQDGHRSIDAEEYLASQDLTKSRFKIHKMFLNGAEPFEVFLLKLKLNKGELRVNVHLENAIKLESVKLVFKGYTVDTVACAPTPTPTVVPEDPAAYSPHIDAAVPTEVLTASTNMVISFSAASVGGTFYCSLDGASSTKCVSPITYQNLANGPHNFVVSAKTPSGAAASGTDSHAWTVDAAPPSVIITNAGSLPLLTNSTLINFAFSSSELGTFLCSLDGAAATVCTSPIDYSNLSEGQHNFKVSAIDVVGNGGGAAEFNWSIDVTAPVTIISQVVPGMPVSNDSSREITFIASETSNFSCAVDGGALASCESPVVFNNLSEGNHYFEVQATDLGGNVGPLVSYAWSSDFSAPVLSFDSVVPAAGLTNSHDIAVEFAANEVANFLCSYDGAVESDCSSPYVRSTNIDGAHTLSVVAVDGAGNRSAAGVIDWNMDFSAPIISFGQITPAGSYIRSDAISLEVVGADNSTLSVTVNGAAVGSGNLIELSNLAEGAYTVSAVAHDQTGNVSNTIQYAFVVDLTAPLLTLSSIGNNPTNLDSRSFNFTSSEEASFVCDLDGAGFSECASPLMYSGLADGEHVFGIQAIDLAGNVSLTSYNWVVDTVAPSTILNATITGSNAAFTLSSNDAEAVFSCSLDGAVFSTCSSPVNYSNLAVGSHTFVVRAKDVAGNVDMNGASYNWIILAPIHTILISTVPTSVLTNITTRTFNFTADQVASDFKCSLDGAVFSSCSSGITVSGLANGTHSFTVKAIDMFGNMDNVGVTHLWAVDTVAPVPSAPPSVSFGVNNLIVSWTTNEPATSQLLWGVGGTANINKATVETTVYTTSHSVNLTGLLSNTTYSFKVSGHDQAGNAYVGAPASAQTRR
jgi:hypothetical protein